jgi:hypothetical protein
VSELKHGFVEVPHHADGYGYAEWDPGLGRDPVVVGAVIQGPHPPEDGWWEAAAGATVRAQARAGKVVLTTAGAEAGQALFVHVTVA